MRKKTIIQIINISLFVSAVYIFSGNLINHIIDLVGNDSPLTGDLAAVATLALSITGSFASAGRRVNSMLVSGPRHDVPRIRFRGLSGTEALTAVCTLQPACATYCTPRPSCSRDGVLKYLLRHFAT